VLRVREGPRHLRTHAGRRPRVPKLSGPGAEAEALLGVPPGQAGAAQEGDRDPDVPVLPPEDRRTHGEVLQMWSRAPRGEANRQERPVPAVRRGEAAPRSPEVRRVTARLHPVALVVVHRHHLTPSDAADRIRSRLRRAGGQLNHPPPYRTKTGDSRASQRMPWSSSRSGIRMVVFRGPHRPGRGRESGLGLFRDRRSERVSVTEMRGEWRPADPGTSPSTSTTSILPTTCSLDPESSLSRPRPSTGDAL